MGHRIEPSTSAGAFSCPHCGAYTTQYWYKLRAFKIDGTNGVCFSSAESVDEFEKDNSIPDEIKVYYRESVERELSGLVYFEVGDVKQLTDRVENLHLSKCYHCDKIAVWVHQNLLFPSHKNGTQPNPDLTDDIIRDFEEARSIVDVSPRGAAALLRLCVQKLCVYLGEKGKNIDADIASLVGKGLDPLIADSLDAVRVIGNESVHAGTIDLRDDRETALQLFDLVNAIAEKLISHPKRVQQVYGKISPEKRRAIEERNAKAKGGTQQATPEETSASSSG